MRTRSTRLYNKDKKEKKNRYTIKTLKENSQKIEATTTIQSNQQEEREEEITIREAPQERSLFQNQKQPGTAPHLDGPA
jgi:hypothetical protein